MDRTPGQPAPIASPSRRGLRLIAAGAVAALIAAAMVWWVGTDRLILVCRQIGWDGGAAMFGLYLLAQILRTLRAGIGLPAAMRPGFLKLFAVVSLHQWSNHVVPARLGEAVFPLFLARFSAVDPARGASLLVRIRLQELSVLGAFVLAALTLVTTDANGTRAPLGGLAIAGAILVVMPLLIERTLPGLLKALGARIDSGRGGVRARVAAFISRTETALLEPEPHRLLSIALTGMLSLCMFALFHVVMRLSGHPIAFHETVLGSSVATVSQLLPLNTLGSFGSLEAGWTLGFALVGVNAVDALSAGFVMHLFVLAFTSAFALASWHWLQSQPKAPGSGGRTSKSAVTAPIA